MQANTLIQREPGWCRVLAFGENGRQTAHGILPLAKHRIADAVMGMKSEQRVVVLGKAIETGVGVMFALDEGDRCLSAGVPRCPVGGGDGHIERAAFKSRAIEMVQRRNCEHRAGSDSVYPRKIQEAILLALPALNARRLRIRIVRYLKIIGARGAHHAKLVVGRYVADERGEQTAAAALIVQQRAGRSFKSVIGAIAVEAEVISRLVAVVTEADLIVGAVIRAVARHDLALAVALKSRAGHDIEDAVGTVAGFG